MLIRVWDDVYMLNQMQTFTNFSNPTRKLNDFLITTKINNSTVIEIQLFVFLPSMEGLFGNNTVSHTYSYFNTSLPSSSVRALTVFAGPIPPELTADTLITYTL